MSSTLAQQAHDFIYEKLARGGLQPGQRLSNRKIAKEMGMSLIPVREAIGRLASEGLVEHHPKLGAFVAQPNKQELEELYDLREALECHAAAAAARLPIHEDDLVKMEEHNSAMRQVIREMKVAGSELLDAELNERWVIADVALHMTLLRAAGNRRIIKTVSNLRVMASIFGYRRTDRSRQRVEVTCVEHDKLVAALRDRQPEQARLAMQEHIRRGAQSALRDFDRRRAEEAAGRIEDASSLHGRIHKLEGE